MVLSIRLFLRYLESLKGVAKIPSEKSQFKKIEVYKYVFLGSRCIFFSNICRSSQVSIIKHVTKYLIVWLI